MTKIKNMKLRYKVGAGVATTAAIVGVGTAAFAYITGGSGSGSGTASVTSTVTLNNLSASATTSAMVPAGAAQATTVLVTDPNNYSVQFGRIHVALDTTAADWPSGCTYAMATGGSAQWFTVGSDTTGAYTATHAGPNSYTGPTVTFNDDPSNDQTGCLGKAIPLTVTLSAS